MFSSNLTNVFSCKLDVILFNVILNFPALDAVILNLKKKASPGCIFLIDKSLVLVQVHLVSEPALYVPLSSSKTNASLADTA